MRRVVKDARTWWWVGLAAVYVGWAVARWLWVPGLEFDEAEQMLHLQRLRPGYGPQPPLFEWSLWALHTLTGGPALLVLALLKAALFVMIAVGVAHAARQACGDGGVGAALGWWALTLAPLLWDAPRTLTHSLLATACIAVLVALSMPLIVAPDRALSRPRWGLIGLVAAAALLAKYNAVLVLGGWAVTVITAWWLDGRSWTRWRERVVHHCRGLPWALLGLLPFGLHVAWVWGQRTQVMDPIQAKMQAPTGGRSVALLPFAEAWLATVGTALLVAAVAVLGAARRPRGDAHTAQGSDVGDGLANSTPSFWLGLLLGYMAAVFVAVAALSWSVGLSDIKLRWVMPMAVPVVVLGGVALLRARPAAAIVLRRASAAVVVASLVLLVWRPTLLAQQGRASWSQLSPAAVARWLDAIGARGAVVIAEPIHLAGALAMQRTAGMVVYPGSSRLAIDADRPVCTFWWVGTRPITSVVDPDSPTAYRVSALSTMRWHAHANGRAPGGLYAQAVTAANGPCPTLGQVYDRLP